MALHRVYGSYMGMDLFMSFIVINVLGQNMRFTPSVLGPTRRSAKSGDKRHPEATGKFKI